MRSLSKNITKQIFIFIRYDKQGKYVTLKVSLDLWVLNLFLKTSQKVSFKLNLFQTCPTSVHLTATTTATIVSTHPADFKTDRIQLYRNPIDYNIRIWANNWHSFGIFAIFTEEPYFCFALCCESFQFFSWPWPWPYHNSVIQTTLYELMCFGQLV